jgi:hypothetical protein
MAAYGEIPMAAVSERFVGAVRRLYRMWGRFEDV